MSDGSESDREEAVAVGSEPDSPVSEPEPEPASEEDNSEEEEKKPTRKRKATAKAVKPPAKKQAADKGPKKPLSAFMYYCQENRPTIKENNPSASFGDLGKLLGAEWKKLSADEKQPYEDKNAADKERYESEGGGPKKRGGGGKKAAKGKGGPKKPLSSYMFFCQDMRATVKEENPDLSFGALGKRLGDMWKDMDDDEKAPYEAKNAADKKRYQNELNAGDAGEEDPEDEAE